MEAQVNEGLQWVAVAGLVFREGRVLAMRRAAGRPGAGLWETISGRVRHGEDPKAAIEREIVEESGVRARVWERPVDAYAALRGSDPMTVIVYRADHVDGDVVISEEHDAFAWLVPDEFVTTSTLTRLARAIHAAS